MGTPVRIQFKTLSHAPPVLDLLSMVTRERNLVMEFPPAQRRDALVEFVTTLREALPEHYRLFSPSFYRDRVSITLVSLVTREEVLEMEDVLVHAARHFRSTATTLARALAEANDVEASQLFDHSDVLESHHPQWCIDVHGEHCCFVHQGTHQTVEVCLLYGDEFGVLDPFFFFEYMRTTPELTTPPQLKHPFHDTIHAMDILKERGALVAVTTPFGDGLIAPSQE